LAIERVAGVDFLSGVMGCGAEAMCAACQWGVIGVPLFFPHSSCFANIGAPPSPGHARTSVRAQFERFASLGGGCSGRRRLRSVASSILSSTIVTERSCRAVRPHCWGELARLEGKVGFV